MRLHKVSLENYRFFENQEFDFKGKNVLLYGENGSGKSSLFYALNKFFQYYKNPNIAKENIQTVISHPNFPFYFQPGNSANNLFPASPE